MAKRTIIPAKAGIPSARGIADPLLLLLSASAVILFVAYVAATSISSEPPPAAPPAAAPGSGIAYAPYVFLDQVTGCEYLSTHTSTGLVPRVAADGKTHMGCKGGAR